MQNACMHAASFFMNKIWKIQTFSMSLACACNWNNFAAPKVVQDVEVVWKT